MKRIVSFLLMLMLMAIPAMGYCQEDKEYLINSGDILDISVWGISEFASKPELKGYIVRPDGKLSFPLIGEQQAAGFSPARLASNITEALAQYINDPKVTVNITKFHTVRVYVLGEISRPGLYELDKQHSVLDAISIGGGYTKDAAKRQVFIIRKSSQDRPQKVDMLKLLREGDRSQNVTLNDGDAVYLSSNHRIDFARDILPLVTGAYYIRHFNTDDD